MENYPNENLVIGGDFIVILNLEEKYGGAQMITWETMDFKEWVGKNKLLEIPTNNGIFTWNNRRKDFSYIVEKLDRFFFKGNFRNMDLVIQATIQPIGYSYHYLVRIELV